MRLLAVPLVTQLLLIARRRSAATRMFCVRTLILAPLCSSQVIHWINRAGSLFWAMIHCAPRRPQILYLFHLWNHQPHGGTPVLPSARRGPLPDVLLQCVNVRSGVPEPTPTVRLPTRLISENNSILELKRRTAELKARGHIVPPRWDPTPKGSPEGFILAASADPHTSQFVS